MNSDVCCTAIQRQPATRRLHQLKGAPPVPISHALPSVLVPAAAPVQASGSEPSASCLQSGIANHRAALWEQVRASFRKNAGETDPKPVHTRARYAESAPVKATL